jgi:hypothetical protein
VIKSRFSVLLKTERKEINPIRIKDSLMNFMIDICIHSKERSLDLFPLDNPKNYDPQKFKTATSQIFAECISNIISVCMELELEIKLAGTRHALSLPEGTIIAFACQVVWIAD